MTLPNTSGVYAIRNLITDERYVGSTHNLRTRWNNHTSRLRKGSHNSSRLQTAWNTIGSQQFAVEVLELVPIAALRDREQFWIDHFDSAKKGYNVCPASDSPLGFRHTEDTRRKLSEWRKAHPTTTDAGRAKMSATRRGKKRAPETVQKMIAAHTGAKRSEAAKANIRAATQAMWARKKLERKQALTHQS